MKLLWRFLGQQPHLDVWERQPLSPTVEQGPRPGDRRDHYERVVAHESPGAPEPDGPYERLARALRAYQVFPPSLVTGVLRRAPVEVGDTFGTCYHFLPGFDLFFAGRVSDVFDGPNGDGWRAGFTLRTVQGHPKVGEETFAVEKDGRDGSVRVSLHSWSRSGLWLTRLTSRWARRVQVRACYAALDHLAGVAEGATSPARRPANA